MLRPLLSLGAWMNACSILIPIFIYIDRFFLGALSSIAAVGYYSVSYDIISRIGVFPASIIMTMFPAFSTIKTDKDRLEHFYVCSLKYLLLAIWPVVIVLVIFAGKILTIWLGLDWALKTTLVFQILAVGMFLNSLAQMPASLLDGIGRSDLKAKIFLFYLVPYIALMWFLISKFGIVGAALAWTLRAGLELILFLSVAQSVVNLTWSVLVKNKLPQIMLVYTVFSTIALAMINILGKTIISEVVIVGIYVVILLMVLWNYILDSQERQFIFSIIEKIG
jgi:O-antigen/teichoic acid export membrane protein